MNRKNFIRNAMLGIGAAFMPKIFMPVGYTIKNRKDGETVMGISEAEAAEYNLQHMIIKSVPPGKYVDLGYLRKLFMEKNIELNDNSIKKFINGMD